MAELQAMAKSAKTAEIEFEIVSSSSSSEEEFEAKYPVSPNDHIPNAKERSHSLDSEEMEATELGLESHQTRDGSVQEKLGTDSEEITYSQTEGEFVQNQLRTLEVQTYGSENHIQKNRKPVLKNRRPRKKLKMSSSENSDDDSDSISHSRDKRLNLERKKSSWVQISDIAEEIVKLSRQNGLSIEVRNKSLIVFKLVVDPVPRIEYSIIIRDGLRIELVSDSIKLPLELGVHPQIITNVDDLDSIIKGLENFKLGHQNSYVRKERVGLISNMFSSLSTFDSENHIRLLQEQIQLTIETDCYGPYSNETLILFCILYMFSPQAYRLLQEPYNLIMPTPSVMKSILLVYEDEPDLETHHFLKHCADLCTSLSSAQKRVVLLVENVRIDSMGFKCFLSDEEVNDNIKVRLFSIAAYQSSFRKLIQVVLFRNASVLDHHVLHRLIGKMITGVESLGFQVAGVVTPGDLINFQAMSLFKSQNPEEEDLEHPVDKRQFLHLIDPFYTLNAVWDEFINSPVEMFLFPGFNDDTHFAALPTDIKKLFEIRNWVTLKYQLDSETTFESRMRYRQVDQHMALRIFDEESFEALVNRSSSLVTPNTQRFVHTFTQWWRLVSDNSLWTPPPTATEGQNGKNLSLLAKYNTWFEQWEDVKTVTAVKPNVCSFSDETIALLKQTTRSILRLGYVYLSVIPKPLRPANIQLSMWRHSNLAALRAIELPVSLYQIRKSTKNLSAGELPIETILNLELPITEVVLKQDPASSCVPKEWELAVSVKSLSDMDDVLPLLVYVASYCAHKITAPPITSCVDCKAIYLTEFSLPQSSACPFVESLSGPDRLVPREYTVNLILHAYAVFEKVFGSGLSNVFPDVFVNRIWLASIIMGFLFFNNFLYPRFCPQAHPLIDKSRFLVQIAVNIFINNYCKIKKISK